MEIYRVKSLKDIILKNPSYAAIGSFDFVHLGHQEVIKRMLNVKGKYSSVVITVDSHPNKDMTMPLNDKLSMFKKFGVDEVIVLEMQSIVSSPADDFIDFLKNNHILSIFVGKDFRFGKYKRGDVSLLKQFFEMNIVEFVKMNNEKISSTTLREMLKSGDLLSFKKAAGYNYSMVGEVIVGNQIGRTIGFNTANIEVDYQAIKTGVYVTTTVVDDCKYKSITNVGFRPTIGDGKFSIETHIINFNQDIYGKTIEIEFLELIREEEKFKNLEELKIAISQDLKYANNFQL